MFSKFSIYFFNWVCIVKFVVFIVFSFCFSVVVVYKWFCLFMVNCKMFVYCFFFIVIMNDKVIVCFIVFIFYFWWVVNNVVNVIWCRVYMMIIYMFYDYIIRNVKFDVMINSDICFFYCVSLRNSVREIV